jgi:hypothetical protein
MVSEQHDTADNVTDETGPVTLSVVGGFVGTVTGLKRGNLPGAVVGGFVGGTVGYLAGASSRTVDPTPGSGRADPISIDVGDTDGEETIEDEPDEDDDEETIEDEPDEDDDEDSDS